MTDDLAADAISPELLALQRVVAGRYSIVRELGRGGMGIVFLARDVALERPVAIKMLPPAMADVSEHRERFVREARTAAALAHPHIVPIHSVEDHDAMVFFVMSFVDGETLAQRVARAGPLNAADALRITQEVSWALAHAHANGIVHRDVKPENILIERGSKRALVTDFGIAWVHDNESTSGQGRIVGTPRYMSPEQASGEPLDGRSDVYSLGAVAYFATTGRAPIDGDTAMAILARQISETPPSLATVRADLPPRFVAAVDRCLAKDRAARWASAEALAGALRSVGGTSLEITAPVRAFVRQADDAGGELATALAVSGSSLLMIAITLARGSGDGFFEGLGWSIDLALYFAIAASMTGLAGWRVWQLVDRARVLIRAGYRHSSIRPALDAEDAALADERPTTAGNRSIPARLAFGVAATGAAVMLKQLPSTVLQFAGFAGSILAPTLTALSLARARGGGSWWHRLLRGAVGKTVFRVAGVGIDASRALPAPGESTSVVLGSAIEALFEALPPEQRRRFSELPSLVAKLERAAVEAKRRASDSDLDSRSTVVIAALESLRLDLLRLHAASGSPDDLTRDLEAAARIGDDIATQLAARESVNRIARGELSPLPGEASTPVGLG